MARILVTGAAGFIGYHVARRLLDRGDEVVGIDNLNDYYDPNLKKARLAELAPYDGFTFEKLDLADREGMARLFAEGAFDRVVHLAAQAGVRYSIENPLSYVDSNLVGFGHILEGCRHHGVQHLVYASSSSVYGMNGQVPYSTEHGVDHPISLYAASKKANEGMAHVYSHLYGLPTTGLRFFTVYGPWGRPDMAIFLFTDAILAGRPIKVFNNGEMERDFTYVGDIVEGVVRTLDAPPQPDPTWSNLDPRPDRSSAPWRVYNIGRGAPVRLMDFIASIERACGREAEKIMQPLQPGDMLVTSADVTALEDAVGYRPSTPLDEGVQAFVDWYRDWFGVG